MWQRIRVNKEWGLGDGHARDELVLAADLELDPESVLRGRAGSRGGLLGDGPSYGVYTAYEDRLANRYRVVVGTATDRAPAADEEVVHLPAGPYAVFRDEGPGSTVAARLWRGVWTRWNERGDRAFDVDFERYEGGPEAARVSLHLALRRTP